MNNDLTHEDLVNTLDYNPDTGCLTWKEKKKGRQRGKPAGGLNAEGYIQIGIGYKRYLAHRLIWLYIYRRWPINQIDHINMIRSDNRLANLRECTNSQNHANTGPQKNNTSGFKGVVYFRGKWRAALKINGRNLYIGLFDSAEDAARAYDYAAIDKFGSFARITRLRQAAGWA